MGKNESAQCEEDESYKDLDKRKTLAVQLIYILPVKATATFLV